MLLLALGLFFFKGFILASVGAVTYDERLELLKDGTFLAKGGAWVMHAARLSENMASYLKPIMRHDIYKAVLFLN